jgi:hypothetical protein
MTQSSQTSTHPRRCREMDLMGMLIVVGARVLSQRAGFWRRWLLRGEHPAGNGSGFYLCGMHRFARFPWPCGNRCSRRHNQSS